MSENFHKAKNFSEIGIEVGEVKLNLQKMMQNKDKAVKVLTKGVEFLFKKNKVTYFKGTGKLISNTQINILSSDNSETKIESENIIISTGSEPVSIPGVDFDEKTIVSSTGALSLKLYLKNLLLLVEGI